jgi:hypothetical protein
MGVHLHFISNTHNMNIRTVNNFHGNSLYKFVRTNGTPPEAYTVFWYQDRIEGLHHARTTWFVGLWFSGRAKMLILLHVSVQGLALHKQKGFVTKGKDNCGH